MEWISVRDRLPKPKGNSLKVTVLGFDGKNISKVIFRYLHRYDDGSLRSYGIFHTFCKKCLEGDVVSDITHWMPLPQPLKE